MAPAGHREPGTRGSRFQAPRTPPWRTAHRPRAATLHSRFPTRRSGPAGARRRPGACAGRTPSGQRPPLPCRTRHRSRWPTPPRGSRTRRRSHRRPRCARWRRADTGRRARSRGSGEAPAAAGFAAASERYGSAPHTDEHCRSPATARRARSSANSRSVLPETPAGLRRGERDGAHRPPASDERDDHRRPQPEGVRELQLLRVRTPASSISSVISGYTIDLRGADRLVDPAPGSLGSGGYRSRNSFAVAIFSGIRVGDLDRLDGPSGSTTSMLHQSATRGTASLASFDKRLAVVQRRREHDAGVGEEREPLVRRLGLGSSRPLVREQLGAHLLHRGAGPRCHGCRR